MWGNCAGLVARPASSVALSDDNDVVGATVAEATLLSANFALGTPSKADDSPGIRTAAASGPAVGHQLPQGSQPVPPGEPLDDNPLPNCLLSGTSFGLTETSSCSHQAPPGLDGTPTMCGLSIRHGLGRKLRRSHEWSPILGRVVPLPLSPARSAMRGQGRSKSGIASLLHVKLSPSALGPTGERQEHLDARVSFAGASQKRRLFRGFDIFMIKWATAHSDGRVLAEIRLAAAPGTQ